jgi:hypothetical protein
MAENKDNTVKLPASVAAKYEYTGTIPAKMTINGREIVWAKATEEDCEWCIANKHPRVVKKKETPKPPKAEEEKK